MKLFFDSSAFVKLLIQENGSEWAHGLWEEFPRKFASRLAYVETRAALASAVRSGRITETQLNSARDEFDRQWDDIDVVEAAAHVIEAAADLADEHVLRGYDTVQLASALSISGDHDTLMLTWDDDLATATCDMGISVVRANDA
jgi:predicted nucleic acid-binding protein